MFSLVARIYERSFVLILAFLLVGLPLTAQAAAEKRAVVVVGALQVRLQPSTSGKVFRSLSRGAVVSVIHSTKGWALVRDKRGQGYVPVSGGQVVVYKAKDRLTVKRPGKATAPVSEKKAKSNLVSLRKAVTVEETHLTVVRREERVVIQDLDRFNRALADARAKERTLKRQLAAVEKKVASALAERAKVASDIRTARRRLMDRLVAYYKLNQMGEMNTFASSGSFHDMVVKKRALTRILGDDAHLLSRYSALLDEKDVLELKLSSDRTALAGVVSDHGKVLTEVEKKYRQRSAALKTVRKEKVLSLAALAEMKDSEKALAAKVASLIKARKAQAAKNRFEQYKGLLKYPVDGKIVKRFGRHKDPRMNITTFENGIDIRTQRGEPVYAVTSGEVLFADWLQGYGNLVIVNHGGNWYSLYAHTDEMFKKRGDRVDAREVIATVGDSNLSGQPDLHFEIRHHGKPLNPGPWFKK